MEEIKDDCKENEELDDFERRLSHGFDRAVRKKATSFLDAAAQMPIFQSLRKGELPACSALYNINITGNMNSLQGDSNCSKIICL